MQDVLAATHCLRKALPDVWDKVETLALYLAALGHDAGHFRLNNAFLNNSKHALCKRYPESVLENYHIKLLFELLEDEDAGIMGFMNEEERTRFSSLVTHLVLATVGLISTRDNFLVIFPSAFSISLSSTV